MAKKTVEFNLSPGDKVKTPVDTEGIVDLCAINSAGVIQYCVEEEGLTRWWNDGQLVLLSSPSVTHPTDDSEG